MSSWPTLTAPAPQNMEPKPEILLPTEIKLIILKNLSETEVYKMRLMSKAWELAANESFFKDDGRFHLRPHRRNLARLEGLVKTRLFVKNIREINIHIGDFDPKQLLADWQDKNPTDASIVPEGTVMKNLLDRSVPGTIYNKRSGKMFTRAVLKSYIEKLPNLTKITVDGFGCPWKGEQAIAKWKRLRNAQVANEDWRSKDPIPLEQYTGPILAVIDVGRVQELVIDTVPVEVLGCLGVALTSLRPLVDAPCKMWSSTPRKVSHATSLSVRARRGIDEEYGDFRLATNVVSMLSVFTNLSSLSLDFLLITFGVFRTEFQRQFSKLEFPNLERVIFGHICMPQDLVYRWIYKHGKTLKEVGFMMNAQHSWSRRVFTELRDNLTLENFSCNHFSERKSNPISTPPPYVILPHQMYLIELYVTRKITWPMANDVPRRLRWGYSWRAPHLSDIPMPQLLEMDIPEIVLRAAGFWRPPPPPPPVPATQLQPTQLPRTQIPYTHLPPNQLQPTQLPPNKVPPNQLAVSKSRTSREFSSLERRIIRRIIGILFRIILAVCPLITIFALICVFSLD